MPATAMTAPAAAVTREDAPGRDPLAAHVITAATVTALAILVWLRRDGISGAMLDEWQALASWALLIGVVNLLPLRVEDFSLTLDLPLLLAVAISVSPEAAAAVAFVATLDTREVGVSRIGLSRALFNRSQVSLCVLVAGLAFHQVAPGLEPLEIAVFGTALALLLDHLLNTGLVVLHLSARRRLPLSLAAKKLTVGTLRRFLATYLGFGVMALVLAQLYRDVGFWPVVAFLVPILVARQALLRDLHLQKAAERLLVQKRMLEQALDHSVAEREDERMRVAGELHDEVLQCLYSLRMSVQASDQRLAEGDTDESRMVDRVDLAIDRLRAVIGGLRSSPLGPGGLVPTLQALVRDSRLEWGKSISLEVSGKPHLSGHDQVLLYQIVREALLNALKHAHSSQVRIHLSSESGRTCATVEDDGVGLFLQENQKATHLGLELMKQRADRLGAKLSISSQRGKGTRLSLAIPSRDLEREPR